MFIKHIYWKHRNDFSATVKCEHCHKEDELKSGYDDAFYHEKVLPSFHCKECGMNRAGEKKNLVAKNIKEEDGIEELSA